jgi:Tol biopolymer transport system component
MELRILIAGLMFGISALAGDTGAELFQKAVTQERAAGNLEEAIKLYQRVAKEFASDRPLAAKALVQEARCYEKLGQDKAVKLYEQVARDFGDQREPAATASARLAVLKQGEHPAPTVPATMTQRKVELPNPSFSPFAVSQTDGQRTIYKDDATGALMICDLADKDKRVILKPKGSITGNFVPSRDFSMVYVRLTKPDGSKTNAVIKSDGTGYREIGGDTSCAPEWSWDDRSVLVCDTPPNGARQLLSISVADGDIRKLRDTDSFDHHPSPDGRFIAYSERPTPAYSSRVFVVPSHGGAPQLISDSGRLMDWTRDGRYLLIVSRHSGPEALYLLPIKEGRRAGDPIFVRYGSFNSGRTTMSGGLLYRQTPRSGDYAAWIGTLQPDGGSLGWEPLSLESTASSEPHWPTWSPDGAQMAYVAYHDDAGQNSWAVRVRDVASGEEREIYRGAASRVWCIWAAQHPSLFCEQHTVDTAEAFSIAIDSGRVQRLGSFPGENFFITPSSDDQAIYMMTNDRPEISRWEIGTQHLTKLDASPGLLTWLFLPDDRWIIRRFKDAIEIRPLAGGDWRPLISLRSTTRIALAPGGKWLIFHDVDSNGKESLFRVATTGGQPERIGDFPKSGTMGFIYVSPDQRKIVADFPNSAELWLLENFEPKQQAAR